MDAFRSEDVDGSRERRRRRWHKDSETAILKFFDNECGHEGFFNFRQCRLPHVLLRTTHELLSQTPKECVSGNSFEKRFLNSLPRRSSCRCAHRDADKDTDSEDEKKREDLFGRQPCRKQLGNWPHKTG